MGYLRLKAAILHANVRLASANWIIKSQLDIGKNLGRGVGSIIVKQFFMIRHGETVANAEGYAAGSSDTPLSEKGRRQAHDARRSLESLPLKPKLIVHSHLSRARDTAVILNQNLQLPMQENSLISEFCFGDWTGLPWDDAHKRVEAGQTPPNGESKHMFVSRVMNGLRNVMGLPGGPVLVVTHGGVFDALAWHYKKKTAAVPNCHLYEFAPKKERSGFPWEMWHHRVSEDGKALRKFIEI
jgi:uncharacterized phosphatase